MSEHDPRRRHQIAVHVGTADLDELEHVNNAVYLRYMEEVVRAHAARVGMPLRVLQSLGAIPVVRRHTITYHYPAKLGDALVVSTVITALRGIRAQRHNEVRLAASRKLLAEAETEWVWLDPTRGRPKPAPDEVLEAFGCKEA